MSKSICFSSSGWAVTYYLGIAAFIQDNFFLDDTIFLSCSGGVLPALLLATNSNIHSIFNTMKHTVNECNNNIIAPSLKTRLIINSIFDYLPENAFELIKNKLKLSVTMLPWMNNIIIDDFKNISEFKDALLCSCYFPIFFIDKLPYYRNNIYIDGAFSNNHPILDENTIFITDHDVDFQAHNAESEEAVSGPFLGKIFGLGISGVE